MTSISPRISAGTVVLDSPCWLWRGASAPDGYGTVSDGTRVVGVHRFAWESANGRDIPPGWQIDHLCMNPRCVNPDHLEPVPQSENQRRAVSWITHCPQGHPYDDENTVVIRNGRGRRCRACQKQWRDEWAAANRESQNAKRNDRRRSERRAAKAAS